MGPVADMIRGIVTAFVVASLGMTALFGANFALTEISPEHYRRAIAEAIESGILATATHLPFAPGKDVYRYGGNDCLIFGTLVMPRDARIKASISPRMPVQDSGADVRGATGYPPAGHCLALAATMSIIARDPSSAQFSEPQYYHRYILGDWTVAALLLAVMSLATTSTVLVVACYAVLAAVALLAFQRLHFASSAERRRPAAFLIIAVTLACFYGLPVFDRSFSFAPTDLVIFAFILFGMVQPFGRISRQGFILTAAAFGTLIAMLEFLTGGVPMALATLIALVALGEAPDWRTLRDRLIVGTTAFTAAIIACFGYKLLAVGVVFGTNESSLFFQTLGYRMGGSVESALSESARTSLSAYHIDPQWLDANLLTRLLFAAAMLIYSSFLLGWGSHFLGAALVVLPTPILLIFGYLSFRDRNVSSQARERLGLAAAGIIPVLWYLVFANHTIIHSSYMVRPLALNIALCIVAALSGCKENRPIDGAHSEYLHQPSTAGANKRQSSGSA